MILRLLALSFLLISQNASADWCNEKRAELLKQIAESKAAIVNGCYDMGAPPDYGSREYCEYLTGSWIESNPPGWETHKWTVRYKTTYYWGENPSAIYEDTMLNGMVVPVCSILPQPVNPPQGPNGGSGGGSGSGSGSGSGGGGCSSGSPGNATQDGSIVSIEAQALGESIPLVGVDFNLYYYSAYHAGRAVDYQIKYEVSGATPREYVTGFALKLERDGVVVDTATYGNTLSNQAYSYNWNGLDATNTFPVNTAKFRLTISETSPLGTFPSEYDLLLGHWNVKNVGLGGWLPKNLFNYDPLLKRIYSADGSYRNAEAKAFGVAQLMLPSEDGSEVYIFDISGNHLFTKTGLLGTTIAAFNYDIVGRLSSIVQPFSKTTTFNRNFAGELISITAPNGQITTVGLDSSGYVQTVTNPNSETFTMSYYGSGGLMQSFQKPNSEISTFEYTTDGFLTKDSHSGGYFFELVKTLNPDYTYEVNVSSALGRVKTVSSVVSGSHNASQKIVLPDGRMSQSTYYLDGQDGTKTEQNWVHSITKKSSDHPRFGSLARFLGEYTISKSGVGIQYLFSETATLTDPSNPFSISALTRTSSVGGTSANTTTAYNPSTQKFTSTTTMGKTGEQTIDSYERVVSSKTGSLNAVAYNYTNEKLTSIVQGTRTTSFAFNTLGLLESVVNPLSQVTSNVYNSANRITSKVLPDSRVIAYSYDSVGNLTSLTPPGRPAHAFSLNGHGLVGAYEPPLLTGVSTVNTSYTYNLDKQLTNITRPSGQYISFNYNATSGKLESLDTPAGNYLYTIDYYTGLPGGIVTPTNITNQVYYTGYDPSQSTTYVNGTSIGEFSRTWGSFDQITSDAVKSGGSGSTVSTINYLYNNDRELSKAGDVAITYHVPNGYITGTTMGTGTTGFTDTYTYNTYGEVTGYQAKRGTTTIYDLILTRDGAGRISGKSQTMNSTVNAYAYNFDSSGRLDQVTKNSIVASNYGYDSNSNRISGNVGAATTLATYDDQDRLTTYNTLSFTYNANGDLLTKTNSTTSQTTSYTYDAFGNLTQVVLPGGTPTTIAYEIDGLNRRVGKKVNGVVQKRWVYMDQYRIAAELNSAGTITKRFIYGSKGNIPDYVIASGVKYRIVSDQLGSPRLVVKQSDGTITQRMDHDEFGRVIEDTNPGYLPFGFAGGLYDNQTGIVRFGARDYDSEIGRWMSKDPILFKGGDTNLYGYTFFDPVNFIDPTGLYGTGDCGYYDQACHANGGSYECAVAPFLCPKFPNGDKGAGNVSSCMRQCLQEDHRDQMPNKNQCDPGNNIGAGDNAASHGSCAVRCLANPENPYNPSGPNLPDARPRIY